MGKSPSPHPGGRDGAIKTLGTSRAGSCAEERPGRMGHGSALGSMEGSRGRGSMGAFGNWVWGICFRGMLLCLGRRGRVRLELVEFLQFSLVDGFLSVLHSACTIPAAQGRVLEPRFLLSSQHPPVIPINPQYQRIHDIPAETVMDGAGVSQES